MTLTRGDHGPVGVASGPGTAPMVNRPFGCGNLQGSPPAGHARHPGPDPGDVDQRGYQAHAHRCPDAHEGDPRRTVETGVPPVFGEVESGVDSSPQGQPDQGGEA